MSEPVHWKRGDRVKVIRPSHGYYGRVGEVKSVLDAARVAVEFDDGIILPEVYKEDLRWVRRPRGPFDPPIDAAQAQSTIGIRRAMEQRQARREGRRRA